MTRVLIIEDDMALRISLVEFLRGEGYEVSDASSSSNALAILDEVSVDVALCDLYLPEMDGLELLKLIKQRSPSISVVMLTGEDSIEMAVQAMRLGAVNYLLKPMNSRQLLDSLREAVEIRQTNIQKKIMLEQIVVNLKSLGIDSDILTKSPQQEFPVETNDRVSRRFIQLGFLTIDQERLMGYCDGQPLELTPTEFEILYCLAQAGGRVVTYEEMVYRLQGVHISREEARRTLSSHFSNLRAKLKDTKCLNYLTNSRGRGYFIDFERPVDP